MNLQFSDDSFHFYVLFNPPFLTHSGKLDAKLSKYFALMQPTSVRIEHRTCTLNAIASHMFDHMHRCLELFYEFVSDTSNVHDIFLSLSVPFSPQHPTLTSQCIQSNFPYASVQRAANRPNTRPR